MSGPGRARCFTWTRPGSRVSRALAIASAVVRARVAAAATSSATRSCGCVDDHSRYAYVEQHLDERAETAAGFLGRAIEHFGELGLDPAEAVMSDNGSPYRSHLFADELKRVGARQIFTPPYTPRWNGKVERFIQTLQNEWAYAHRYPSSGARARTLGSFVRYYNRQRPHSSLGDRPPISRVPNVCGQDS
jgi:transposase InsO family protein